MSEKRFTLEEANALLPAIQLELAVLQETKRKFADKFAALRRLREVYPSGPSALPDGADPFFELECELEFLQIEARSQISSFGLKGVQLKDIDAGLVDFPAMIEGREVLLCWRQSEDRVSHYHGWDEGFAGRKPLADPS